VLSHKLWQERFRGDPRAIGKQLVVNGVPRTIIGVMPERFAYPSSSIQLWLPVGFDPANAQPASFNFVGVAGSSRRVSGVGARRSRARVAARRGRVLQRTSRRVARGERRAESRVPSRIHCRIRVARPLALDGSVLLVLLVACANAAGLFLVRAEQAQVELAVRGALGSG
jgi:hypothetical protein